MVVWTWRMSCPAHTGNEVSSCVGSLAGVALTMCALWPYGCCVFVMGRFPASGRLLAASQHLVGNWCP